MEAWSAILENFMDPVVCIFMCVIDIITLGIILVSWKKLEHRTRRVHLIVFMQTGLRLNIGRQNNWWQYVCSHEIDAAIYC